MEAFRGQLHALCGLDTVYLLAAKIVYYIAMPSIQ